MILGELADRLVHELQVDRLSSQTALGAFRVGPRSPAEPLWR